MKRFDLLLACVLTLLPFSAFSDLLIPITKGGDDATPIAIVPFRLGEQLEAQDQFDQVISGDLARSGFFRPLEKENMLSYPTVAEEVYFRDWRVQGIQYLVIGRVANEGGRYAVTYELFSITEQRRIFSETLRGTRQQFRDIAHLISDEVFERISGIRGAFSTKLAFVLARGIATPNQRYRLEIADADGARSRTIFESKESIMSPTWSPNAGKLAYVSFETNRSAVYLHDLASGARERIAAFPGLNSAPSFSPDGRSLAFVSSKDGNPEIYLMDLASKRLRQLTRYRDIDTEPSFTSDGRTLVFTSNRGGKPQIYGLEVATGLTERMTFEGDYNARGRLLPTGPRLPPGERLAYVHRQNDIFHIAVLDLTTGLNQVLTQTALDESPSVSANGTMLIYATHDAGRGILSVVSVEGRVKYALPSPEGDVREPAWSPFLDVRSRLQ